MATIDRRNSTVGQTDAPAATTPNAGLAIKTAVRVVATTNINLQTFGLGIVDGVQLVAGDRVLLPAQTDATQNGPYSASSGTWQRTSDAADNSQWADGLIVFIRAGTVNGGLQYVLRAADPVLLGTSALPFVPWLSINSTGTGPVVLQTDPTIINPTIDGTVTIAGATTVFANVVDAELVFNNTAPGSNVVAVRNSAPNGFSAFKALDNTGAEHTAWGYDNGGAGTVTSNSVYLEASENDEVSPPPRLMLVQTGTWDGVYQQHIRLDFDTTGNVHVFHRYGAAGNVSPTPALTIDVQAASAATGLDIVTAAAGSGVTLKPTSTGTNENLFLQAKGTGIVAIGNGLGPIALGGPTYIGPSGALTTYGYSVEATYNGTFAANSDITNIGRLLNLVNDSTTANSFAAFGLRSNPSGGANNQMLDFKLVNPQDGTSKLVVSFGPNGIFTDVFSLTSAGILNVTGGYSLAGTALLAITAIGASLTLSGGTLSVASHGIANSLFRQSAALSLIGNATNATADVADIAGTANQIARVNGAGTALAFGAIDLSQSAAVGASILGTANGGLNNAFFAISGPASTIKTYTVPNASCTLLTTNAAVTVAQGGTGAASFTAHGVLIGNAGATLNVTAAMTDGQLLVGQTSADPLPKTLSGDASLSAAGALTVAANAVTYAKFQQGAALSLLGVAGASTANYAAIAGTANQIARVNGAGTALAFGAIDLSQSAAVGANTITLAAPFATVGAFNLTFTATATTNATLPAGTHTLAAIDLAQTWTAAQTFTANQSGAVNNPSPAISNGAYFQSGGTRVVTHWQLYSDSNGAWGIGISPGQMNFGIGAGAGFFFYPNAIVLGGVPAVAISGNNGLAVNSSTDPGAGNILLTGFLNSGGYARVTTDFSVTSSAALTNVTGLSATLIAGKTYAFVASLFTTSNSAGGVQAAIGGTATATSIIYEGEATAGAAIAAQTRASALGTAVAAITAVTAARIDIAGTITVNAGGTLTVQFAQNASNGTASVVKQGSFLKVWQIT